jgi:hypothetical protein
MYDKKVHAHKRLQTIGPLLLGWSCRTRGQGPPPHARFGRASSRSKRRKCFGSACKPRTVFAAMRPLPATAGTPMPGKVASPHIVKPGTGVVGGGNTPSEGWMAGP